MKKYILPCLCLGLLSGTLFSQNTYVTGNAALKVQPNTLFYHGGDLVLTANVTEAGVIKNDGNIRINGNFNNSNVSTIELGAFGKNFISQWISTNSYGQVIIRQGATSTGMLSMQKPPINPAAFTWGQFAIPYQFSNAETAFETLFPGLDYKTSGGRYGHSIMTWDNKTRPEYDHLAATAVMKPTDYVLLNLVNDPNLITQMSGGTLAYAGTPANGTHVGLYRPAMYPEVTVPWSTWKNNKNYYSEKYSTYVDEHIRVPQSQHHGRYYFQFGNPYTSNIDLSYIGTNGGGGDTDNVYVQNLLGVVKITGTGWNDNIGVVNPVAIRAVWSGTQWGGNANALIIKPFETFYVGLTSVAGTDRADRNFNFNDGLKTFSMVPALTPGVDPGDVMVGKQYTGDDSQVSQSEDKALTNSVISVSNRSSFYQLGLNLYTENDISTGNTVYVIVDSKSQTGSTQPIESEYTDFTTGFFLTQEKADGTEVTSPNGILQINAVHPKYVSKPIQLFFKKAAGDLNGYYLKADLFYQSIFNQLKLEDGNFIDGNSFFFYDKEQDVLLPITTDFSYYIERTEELQNSRYVVYWNGGPQAGDQKMDISEELAGTTQVYKDGEIHKIRFDKSWDSADIAVYDLAGRSIHRKEGVKTDVDYVLDLPNTSVFIVKIQSNTGETVTQKIIR